jgi:hypothetical protein
MTKADIAADVSREAEITKARAVFASSVASGRPLRVERLTIVRVEEVSKHYGD